MKDQIVEKLRKVLSEGINSECQVVYILCELRKLMDKYQLNTMPLALKIYCHWALHIDLDRQNTTISFLQEVDDFAERVVTQSEDVIKDAYLFKNLLRLNTFRKELGNSLRDLDLPTSLCDEDHCWHGFIQHYAGVIENGSLSCESKTPQLKYVDRLVFSKGRKIEDTSMPFGLVWNIYLRDGRSIVVETSEKKLPNGMPIAVSGITLEGWNASSDN
ncbi:MAG: hypothetical protein P4M01_09870 [Acidobacteriota bacterium]|nr:hypothetical protein [Acidobacteriota bacterium]